MSCENLLRMLIMPVGLAQRSVHNHFHHRAALKLMETKLYQPLYVLYKTHRMKSIIGLCT